MPKKGVVPPQLRAYLFKKGGGRRGKGKSVKVGSAYMPKKGKGGKKGGGRHGGKLGKKGGGFHFSAVSLGRKIGKMSSVIDAAVDASDNFAGGDFAGGLSEFFGTLSADLTAYNPLTKSWEPTRLAVGYGPAAVVEVVNTGIAFLKGIARSFGGRGASRPQL